VITLQIMWLLSSLGTAFLPIAPVLTPLVSKEGLYSRRNLEGDF